MASTAPVITAEDVTSLKAPRKDVDEGARATSSVKLTLLRKCGMSAGVMAAEAVIIFSYLFTLPLLQTLGTPVSLMTTPGVVSAILSMGFLPILGRLADGGSQPHRRKKPVVVGVFCLAVLGLGFMFGGAALHVWGTAPLRPQHHQSATGRPMGPATSPSPRPQQHQSATGRPMGPATSPLSLPQHHQSATGRPMGPATSPLSLPQQHQSATGRPMGPATSPSPRLQLHQSATGRPMGPATSPSPRPQQHQSATGRPMGPATSVALRPLHDLPWATASSAETVSSPDAEDGEPLTVARPGLEDPANERTLSASLNSSQADVVTTVLRSAAVPPQGFSRESGPGESVPSAPSAHPATLRSPRINARGEQRETTPLIHVTSGQTEGTATAGSSTPDSGHESSMGPTTTDPTGAPTLSQALGLPVAALLAMAGTVVMDVAVDLTNSAVKTCMLTHSLPADHASLLVTGVFMSALGGCVTSVSGLVHFSSLLPGVDPACSQAMGGLLILLVLCIVCCTCTLVFTPRPLAPPPLDSAGPEDRAADGVGGDMGVATMTLQTEVQENVIMAMTSPVNLEHPFAALSLSLGLASRCSPPSPDEATDTTCLLSDRATDTTCLLSDRATDTTCLLSDRATETTCLLSDRATDTTCLLSDRATDTTCLLPDRATYSPIAGNTMAMEPDKTRRHRNWKLELTVVWLSAFFTFCCNGTFHVVIADYLGKVVHKGDPEAEAGSVEHALYVQGLRSASVCMLVVYTTYVLFSLCHSKVLAVLGPKIEYLLINLMVMSLMLALYMTGSMTVVYVTSALIGLSRAALFTVPFMMANNICHMEAESKGEGHPKVGFTMALVTTAVSCAYLVISCVIGPLVHVTGDPSAPLLVGVAGSLLAAATAVCYRSS